MSSATGACFCGGIAAEMYGRPCWAGYDHDRDCRRATGGALVVWIGYQASQFRITRGRPKSFSKTQGVVRTFCGECGSSISYADEALAGEVYVALGFFDYPERLRPQVHAYCREMLPWLHLTDDLPRCEGYSRLRDEALGAPNERSSCP